MSHEQNARRKTGILKSAPHWFICELRSEGYDIPFDGLPNDHRSFDAAHESGQDLVQIEDQRLSWNHAQAGAWMARNWEFPDVLVCCIGLHHTPVGELEAMDLAESPVAAVAISSWLPDAEATCCRQAKLSTETYHELCADTNTACSELASLFDVAPPTPLGTNGQNSAT